MTSSRLLIGGCVCAFGLAAPIFTAPASAATVSATAGASVSVVGAAGVQVVTPLLMPSVTVTSSGGASFSGSDPSVGTTAAVAGNARLMIASQDGTVLSLDVPPTITVTRAGGDQALTVRTTVSSGAAISGDGVLMGGALTSGSATSVDIGGQLALASSKKLAPGPYAGLIVVVVELN